MAYVPVNPYISLSELIEELKMKASDVPSGSSTEDDLLRAIVNASRWVDDYTRRDFFFHDFTVTPMVFDQFDEGVYDRRIFPRFQPILSITEINANGIVLVEATDYVVKNHDEDNQTIFCSQGSWFLNNAGWWPSRDRMTIEIKGTFGYSQQASVPVTEEGDDADQLQNWTLHGLSTAPVYWQLASVGSGNVRVRLYSDAAFASLIAQGTGLAVSTISLAQSNGSGVSGTVEVDYSIDDVDALNIITPQDPIVDSSLIPAGIPERIKLAVRLVAAAISGRNRKEIVGLDGTKESIITSEIPKTVFSLLGKRAPILF